MSESEVVRMFGEKTFRCRETNTRISATQSALRQWAFGFSKTKKAGFCGSGGHWKGFMRLPIHNPLDMTTTPNQRTPQEIAADICIHPLSGGYRCRCCDSWWAMGGPATHDGNCWMRLITSAIQAERDRAEKAEQQLAEANEQDHSWPLPSRPRVSRPH